MAAAAPTTLNPFEGVEKYLKNFDEFKARVASLVAEDPEFCTDLMLKRYLVAREGNMKKAEEQLRETLKWRAEWKPETITAEMVREQLELGRMYVHGFDRYGRPVVYTKKKPHPASPEMATKLSLYTMEKALRMMKQTGAAQVVWIVDLEGPRSNTQNLGSELRKILNAHYPECLGVAVIVNPPRFVTWMWKVFKGLLDRRTTSKITFVNGTPAELYKEVFSKWFEPHQLETRYGGTMEYVYDFARDDASPTPTPTGSAAAAAAAATAAPVSPPAADAEAAHVPRVLGRGGAVGGAGLAGILGGPSVGVLATRSAIGAASAEIGAAPADTPTAAAAAVLSAESTVVS